jgi:para-nitrobenzyl esterase
MHFNRQIAGGLAGILIILSSCSVGSISERVKIEGGYISGVTKDSVTSFKGIPFAAPPVKKLRWKEPQPVTPWEGVRKCDAFGPSPMQPKPVPFAVYTPEFLIPESPISEDCLYLNVWTGAKSGKERRPVFVWIYGGGFSSGGAGVPIYDGASMAAKGIVFVSINYRVGVFGFLATPGLSNETETKHSGNYGLMDQIAALQWVQKNIHAFGGDPGNVTIAGQSAGSMSVNCLVASPLAKDLFHKAIAESGSGMIPNPVIASDDLKTAEQKGYNVVQSLYASTTDDLRGIPADTLLAKVKERFGPIIDGYILPKAIPDIFAEGKQNDVPLLTGWNADEGFVWQPQTKDEYLKEAKERYGNEVETFLKYYPASSEEETQDSRIALSRDLIFGLSNYRWAITQSKGKKPAYVYYFERKPPATAEFQKYKAFHTAEVAYALDNLQFLNRPWEETDRILAKQMSAYWVNFISTGDPNGVALPPWPKFDSAQNLVMTFSDTTEAKKIRNREALDFLYDRMASH